jgi:hypothetical protein
MLHSDHREVKTIHDGGTENPETTKCQIPNSQSQNPNEYPDPIFENPDRKDSEFWRLIFKSHNLHQRWRLEKPVNRSKRIEMGAT